MLIIGTSVSRHWHFALQEVLSRDHGKAKASDGFVETLQNKTSSSWLEGYRESEKEICGGGVKSWKEVSFFNALCTNINAATNTLLIFQWTSPFQSLELMRKAVANLLTTMPTLGLNVRNSTLLLNAGLELAVNYRGASIVTPEKKARLDMPGIINIMDKVLLAGGEVGWRLSTQLCCEKKYTDVESHTRTGPFHPNNTESEKTCSNRGGLNMAEAEIQLKAVNREVVQAIESDPGQRKIKVLDAWSMTPDSKCNDYEDWVHHPILAYEQIESWLTEVLKCPCSIPVHGSEYFRDYSNDTNGVMNQEEVQEVQLHEETKKIEPKAEHKENAVTLSKMFNFG